MTKRRDGYVIALCLSALFLGCRADARGDEPVAEETLAEQRWCSNVSGPCLSGLCCRIRSEWVGHQYLDAYTTPGGDVVMREWQDDGTQLWCLTGGVLSEGSQFYTIQHQSFDGQYLDAYENGSDYKAVLRDRQTDGSQQWIVEEQGDGGEASFEQIRLRQRSSGRYLDRHSTAAYDYRVVTRPSQSDESQRWELDLPWPFYSSCEPPAP